MIQFFQTRMGEKFFNGTFPRLVTAVEALVENYSVNKELENRVAVLEALVALPTLLVPMELECSDGYRITVVERDRDYPKLYRLTFPSYKEDSLEAFKIEVDNSELLVAYESVPEKVLAQVIAKHGGINA